MNDGIPAMLALQPHPAMVTAAGIALQAGIALDAGGGRSLRLRYELADARGAIAWPAAAASPARLDNLWKSTCCELFVHVDDGPAYLEYNFSPSGDWAAYGFAGYRTRGPDPQLAAPRIRAARGVPGVAGAGAWLEAEVELPLPLRAGARFGLGAVLARADDARTSYWALAHPRAEPDFHDEAGHVLALATLSGAGLAGAALAGAAP